MKVKITHLKAPWPAGAKVDDIVEVPSVPTWAVGKCEPAPDDAEAAFTYKPGEVVELADLRTQVAAAHQSIASVEGENVALRRQLAKTVAGHKT